MVDTYSLLMKHVHLSEQTDSGSQLNETSLLTTSDSFESIINSLAHHESENHLKSKHLLGDYLGLGQLSRQHSNTLKI